MHLACFVQRRVSFTVGRYPFNYQPMAAELSTRLCPWTTFIWRIRKVSFCCVVFFAASDGFLGPVPAAVGAFYYVVVYTLVGDS